MINVASNISIDNTSVVSMRHNGSEVQVTRNTMFSGGGVNNTAIVSCEEGDTLGVQVYQGHTSPVELRIRFSIIKLR